MGLDIEQLMPEIKVLEKTSPAAYLFVAALRTGWSRDLFIISANWSATDLEL